MKKRILDLQFRKIEWDIIVDKWENDLPTYYILKSTYILGFHLFGELFGQEGKDTPFQTLEGAEEYLKLRLGGQTKH